MRLHIALLAGLVIATGAEAKIIGTFIEPDASSMDDFKYLFHDTESGQPECQGQKVLSMFWISGGKSKLLSVGCWEPKDDKILITMLSAEGKEYATHVVARGRIDFKDNGKNTGIGVSPSSPSAAADERFATMRADLDPDTFYYAGLCAAADYAQSNARGGDQLALAARLKGMLRGKAGINGDETESYCQSRIDLYKKIMAAKKGNHAG